MCRKSKTITAKQAAIPIAVRVACYDKPLIAFPLQQGTWATWRGGNLGLQLTPQYQITTTCYHTYIYLLRYRCCLLSVPLGIL